jgi:hypothetical protein
MPLLTLYSCLTKITSLPITANNTQSALNRICFNVAISTIAKTTQILKSAFVDTHSHIYFWKLVLKAPRDFLENFAKLTLGSVNKGSIIEADIERVKER